MGEIGKRENGNFLRRRVALRADPIPCTASSGIARRGWVEICMHEYAQCKVFGNVTHATPDLRFEASRSLFVQPRIARGRSTVFSEASINHRRHQREEGGTDRQIEQGNC